MSANYQLYQSFLTQPINIQTIFHHEFMSLENEAKLEFESLFHSGDCKCDHNSVPNATHNEAVLKKLYDQFNISNLYLDLQIERLTQSNSTENAVGSKYNSTAIVCSIGSSSTQVYCADRVIGAYYIGSSSILSNPTLIRELIRDILLTLVRLNISGPLILTNSIGYYYERHIFLNPNSQSQDMDMDQYLNDQLRYSKSEASLVVLQNLFTVVQQTMTEWSNPCILLCKDPQLQLHYGWLSIKAKEIYEEYQRRFMSNLGLNHQNEVAVTVEGHTQAGVHQQTKHRHPYGFYMVDFGGGGMSLSYYQINTMDVPFYEKNLIKISSNRAILACQDSFVKAITDGHADENKELMIMKQFLHESILSHTIEMIRNESNNRSQAKDLIVECYIFQTGLLRQHYYVQHIEPSCVNLMP
jgi:hypothetical protein